MMTFSRSTVSLTLFLIFLLLSAFPAELDGLGLVKDILALVFGAAGIVVAIQGKRLERSPDTPWTYVICFPLIYWGQLVTFAAKYGAIPNIWLTNSLLPLVFAPIVLAAFVDLVNLFGRGNGSFRIPASNDDTKPDGRKSDIIEGSKERT